MPKTTQSIGSVNVPEGCYLEDHERATAELLKAAGKHVTFVIPKRQPGFHTPDIMMDGKYWEIKSLEGKSRRSIQERLKEAVKQSDNVIIDFRWSKLLNDVALNETRYQAKHTNGLRTLIVIDKNSVFHVIKATSMIQFNT